MARSFSLPVWASGAIGGVGLAFIAWQALDVAAFLSRAARVDGAIVDARQHPTIRFALPDGRAVDFVQNGFVDRPAGAAVPVAYDPADPDGTAVADTLFPLWWTVLLPMPGTALFLGAAVAGWRMPLRVGGF